MQTQLWRPLNQSQNERRAPTSTYSDLTTRHVSCRSVQQRGPRTHFRMTYGGTDLTSCAGYSHLSCPCNRRCRSYQYINRRHEPSPSYAMFDSQLQIHPKSNTHALRFSSRRQSRSTLLDKLPPKLTNSQQASPQLLQHVCAARHLVVCGCRTRRQLIVTLVEARLVRTHGSGSLASAARSATLRTVLAWDDPDNLAFGQTVWTFHAGDLW